MSDCEGVSGSVVAELVSALVRECWFSARAFMARDVTACRYFRL